MAGLIKNLSGHSEEAVAVAINVVLKGDKKRIFEKHLNQ